MHNSKLQKLQNKESSTFSLFIFLVADISFGKFAVGYEV